MSSTHKFTNFIQPNKKTKIIWLVCTSVIVLFLYIMWTCYKQKIKERKDKVDREQKILEQKIVDGQKLLEQKEKQEEIKAKLEASKSVVFQISGFRNDEMLIFQAVSSTDVSHSLEQFIEIKKQIDKNSILTTKDRIIAYINLLNNKGFEIPEFDMKKLSDFDFDQVIIQTFKTNFECKCYLFKNTDHISKVSENFNNYLFDVTLIRSMRKTNLSDSLYFVVELKYYYELQKKYNEEI